MDVWSDLVKICLSCYEKIKASPMHFCGKNGAGTSAQEGILGSGVCPYDSMSQQKETTQKTRACPQVFHPNPAPEL